MSNETDTSHKMEELLLRLKDLSLGQLLLKQLAMHGTRVAYVDSLTGKEKTYKDILNASRKLAVYLQREGFKMNDAIAICAENNLEYVIPVCATFYLGGIVCPLNPLYSKGELKHSLGISKPKYIFTSTLSSNNIKNVLKELHWLPRVLMLTESDNIDPSWTNMYKSISSISNDQINMFDAVSTDVDNHVTAILCSSGTTGLPKGVMLTDKNLISVIEHTIMYSFYQQFSVSQALLPFFHSYAFTIMVIRLVIGNKSVVLPRFEEKLFLQSIEKYRIEMITLVPPLMLFLAKHPLVDKYDLSSLKAITCGAAPLSEEIYKTVLKRLRVPVIRQGYGLTETTLAVLWSAETGKYGSFILAPGISGKVIPLGEYETDKTLGPNHEGELCFKGNVIMKGYRNDEESTKATIDKDGWLHTGDIGYYDEEGYFYIVDRIKELIKYKAYQVPPAELEAILLTCPGVKDAAVIGIPDEAAGELPLAFIVKQDNFVIHERDIIQYVDERVSNPKRLRGGVRFVDNIPKTASGKILRRLLRDILKSKL